MTDQQTPKPAGESSGVPADYRPPRGYRWPPFEPDHTLSLKHGAYSPRIIDPLAKELVDATLIEAMADPNLTYLAEPRFAHALIAWAKSEIVVQRLHAAAIRDGYFDGKDCPAGRALEKWEKIASGRRYDCGLSPLGAATLLQRLAEGKQANEAARGLAAQLAARRTRS